MRVDAMSVDCAEHAIAFACGIEVQDVQFTLTRLGRPVVHDGTTDKQIRETIEAFGREAYACRVRPPTVRTFAREGRSGSYIIFTSDHVVACVNGFLCDRPENSDLARIEKVWKII